MQTTIALSQAPRVHQISQREHEVLQLIVNEYTSGEIAQELYISKETVISHRKNIMAKLDARNTAGLVRRAIESGVVQLTNV